jgi:hypothetical protein
MTPRDCHAPIRAATGEAFSDAEIDDILDRLARRYKRAKGKAPSADDTEVWAQAAAEMTREDVEAALQARRLEHYAQAATARRGKALAAMTADGLNEAEALRAFNVGTDRQVTGGADSVDAEGRGAVTAAVGRRRARPAPARGPGREAVRFLGRRRR